jgi:hypothetical protein
MLLAHHPAPEEFSMIHDTTQSLSFGTDPVAAALRATFHTSTLSCTARAAEAAPGASSPLDVDRLYPNLSVASDRPGVLSAAVGRLAVAAAAFRHAIASL